MKLIKSFNPNKKGIKKKMNIPIGLQKVRENILKNPPKRKFKNHFELFDYLHEIDPANNEIAKVTPFEYRNCVACGKRYKFYGYDGKNQTLWSDGIHAEYCDWCTDDIEQSNGIENIYIGE